MDVHSRATVAYIDVHPGATVDYVDVHPGATATHIDVHPGSQLASAIENWPAIQLITCFAFALLF